MMKFVKVFFGVAFLLNFTYLYIMKSNIDIYVVLWIIIFGLVIFNWIYNNNNDDDN